MGAKPATQHATIDAVEKVYGPESYTRSGRLQRLVYEEELLLLQIELVKLQEWIRSEGRRVVVLFEGRDAAGKGGAITRITESTNPRVVRVVALGTPERPREDAVVLPAVRRASSRRGRDGPVRPLLVQPRRGRAGDGLRDARPGRGVHAVLPAVRVACLQRAGIVLVKYWFSVSDEEQERRFQSRLERPDEALEAVTDGHRVTRAVGGVLPRAKDEMLAHTDTEDSPWWVVDGDDKRTARLNCISHLLSLFPYEDVSAPLDRSCRPAPRRRVATCVHRSTRSRSSPPATQLALGGVVDPCAFSRIP